jgi:hypothetical protein
MGLERGLGTLGLNTLGAAAYAMQVTSFKLLSQPVFIMLAAKSVSSFPKDGSKRL